MTDLALKHGLSFPDLYGRDGLVRLDRAFVAHLVAGDVGLHDRLMAARAAPETLDRKAESDLLVDLAPHLEDFLGDLFGIAADVRELQARHDRLAPLYYNKADRERGYIETNDRYGELRRFPIMTVSIAAVTTGAHAYKTYAEVATAAAEAKQVAKSIPGSSYVRDPAALKVQSKVVSAT